MRRVLYLLTLAQVGLFGVLFFQLHISHGDQHFQFDTPPQTWHWVEFVLSHILRSADVLDGLEEFHIHLQNITHRSTLVGILLVAMHLSVDIFLIGLLVRWLVKLWVWLMEHWSSFDNWLMNIELGLEDFWKEHSRTIRWTCSVLFLLLLAAWGWWQNLQPSDWALWPLDNILRTIDVGDMFQVFNWKLHTVKDNPLNATVGVIFRLFVGIFVVGWITYVRLYYFQGLGSTVEGLVETLGKKNDRNSEAAAKALSNLPPEAIPEIYNRLVENDNSRHHSKIPDIFRAYGQQGSAFLIEALREREDGQFAAQWLGGIGKPVLPALFGLLGDSDSTVRKRAGTALSEVGQVAVPGLIMRLSHRSARVREGAALGLASISKQTKKGTQALLEATKDDVPEVRRAAVMALGRADRAQAVMVISRLIELIHDPHWPVQLRVAKALGNFGEMAAPAVSPLIQAYSGANQTLQEAIVAALPDIGPVDRVVPKLFQGLSGGKWEPRLVELLAKANQVYRLSIIETLGRHCKSAPEGEKEAIMKVFRNIQN